MLYLDSTKADNQPIGGKKPIFKNWTNALIEARAVEEMKKGSFGTFEVVQPCLNLTDNNKEGDVGDLKMNEKKVI